MPSRQLSKGDAGKNNAQTTCEVLLGRMTTAWAPDCDFLFLMLSGDAMAMHSADHRQSRRLSQQNQVRNAAHE